MSLRNLWSGKRSMKDKCEMVNLGISWTSATLGYVPTMHLEYWDLVDSNVSLAKMQHKL